MRISGHHKITVYFFNSHFNHAEARTVLILAAVTAAFCWLNNISSFACVHVPHIYKLFYYPINTAYILRLHAPACSGCSGAHADHVHCRSLCSADTPYCMHFLCLWGHSNS